MINPRPFIKKRSDNHLYPFCQGGTGRYIAVLCTSSQKIDFYDRDLLTSANYAGSGSWTTTPLISSLTLASPYSFYGIIYSPINKSIYCIGATRIEQIDFDPSSGTFLTSIGNTSISSVSSVSGVTYDPFNDIIVFGNSTNGVYVFDPKTTTISNLSPIFSPLQTGRNHQIKFINSLSCFCTVDSSSGPIFKKLYPQYGYDYRSIKTIAGWDNHGSGGFITNDKNNFYYNGSGNVRVVRMSDFNPIASITQTNARLTIPSWAKQSNRIFTGSAFSNSISYLETTTLSNGGNVAKGNPETNENGSRIILCTGDIALVMPMSTSNSTSTFTRVHIFSTNGTPAYIGYIDGSTQGNFTTHSYGSNWIVSNIVDL